MHYINMVAYMCIMLSFIFYFSIKWLMQRNSVKTAT